MANKQPHYASNIQAVQGAVIVPLRNGIPERGVSTSRCCLTQSHEEHLIIITQEQSSGDESSK